MFGHAPFGVRPFCGGDEIRASFFGEGILDVSLEYIIYVATSRYVTKPTDALPSQPFRGTLQSWSFRRSISGGAISSLSGSAPSGTLVISNADAFYDFLPQSYSLDGRELVVKVGLKSGSYDDDFVVFTGTMSSWTIDDDAVTIAVEDYSYKLGVPAQGNIYAGTGGVEGGDDLAGKRKPIALGYVHNASPPLVVPSLLINQVNDGPVLAIPAAYDRGVALTLGADHANYAALAAATVGAGTYATCLALGLLRTGSTPQVLTADVQGDNSDGYVETTADIVRWLIRNKTAIIDPDGLAAASFTVLNTAQPALVDYWLDPDDTSTVAAVINNLMDGIGSSSGFRRDGSFEVKQFLAPTGGAVGVYNRIDIIDLKREPLPSSLVPPPWRWRVPYGRVWTTQTDVAGSVSAARKAFIAEPFRLAEASSTAIQLDHPFAQDPAPVEGYFSELAAATTEAQRLRELYRTTRALYRIKLPRKALVRWLGEVISVTYPRFDLSEGRLMTIVSIAEDINFSTDTIDTVEVVAYG